MVKKKAEVFTKDKEYKHKNKNQETRRVAKETPGLSGKFSAK
ncbi:hypothetical protein [Clostridium aciditolerans]|nr:hypothetical protein [Clostridium aciditolerans]